MEHWSNFYSAGEMKQIAQTNPDNWPANFRGIVNRKLADQLFDSWRERNSEETYIDYVQELVDDLTYGLADDNNNQLTLKFDEE